MSHVITSACTKDMKCVEVCPQNAMYDAGAQLVINPDDCVDCGLCVQECPVNAIFPQDDVPAKEKASIDKRDAFFRGSADAVAKARCAKP